MPTFPPVADQLAVIRRGIEKIVPEEELAQKLEQSLKTGTPLRIKYGIDPTGIDVHLGHTVPLRKLRQFQELGHQAVLIIGNYTALVGDPSGRDAARTKKLTEEDVERNARDYLEQVGKVIDLSRTEIHRNGDWFARMTFAQVLGLCGKVTVAQMLTRDDFAKRYAANTPIYLHECLYPLMQGWDSVEIKSDVELGGTEQLYSFMLARDLQREQSLPQQIGVMSPILVGTDGVRRMGKSLGNYIGISESPYDMMKKFMQIPDGVMRMYFELLTNIPLTDVEALLSGHPKEAKVRLAKSVIAEYHNATAADEAADRWQREIGGGGLPEEIPTLTVKRGDLKEGKLAAAVLLKSTGLCASTSDARRLIAQGGASTGAEKTRMTSHDQPIDIVDGLLVWAGKKKFGKVELQD
ncbi:MAG: tyrosine--tRNA ligase [Planctomycetaceae bacterium]|nr:tyrosine--tRNA ligase [Planctomycetaceae bacterium]